MKTVRVGIASKETCEKRATAIAQGKYVPAKNEPKVWFESLLSFSQVLSDHNRALLKLIIQNPPMPLNELAELSGRERSNLSRTLRNLERYGIVELKTGPNRQLVPTVNCSSVELEIPFKSHA